MEKVLLVLYKALILITRLTLNIVTSPPSIKIKCYFTDILQGSRGTQVAPERYAAVTVKGE